MTRHRTVCSRKPPLRIGWPLFGCLLLALSWNAQGGPTPYPPPPDRSSLDQAPKAPEPPSEPVHNPCWLPNELDRDLLDSTRSILFEISCNAAFWVDRGLSGKTDPRAHMKRTHGYIEVSALYSEFDGFSHKVRAKARVDLPNTRRRLSAFIEREDENDAIQDRSESFALRSQFPRLEDNGSWLAGLGYNFPGNDRVRTGVRVGVASLSDPRLFVRGKLHYTAYSDTQRLVYGRLSPFWSTRDGLGASMAWDFNYLLRKGLLLRQSNTGTISERIVGLDWYSALILYQNLDNLASGRGVAWQVFVRGQTDEPEPLAEYGVRAVYRYPMFEDRMHGEVLVGYGWPRIDPNRRREGSSVIGYALTLPFGLKDH